MTFSALPRIGLGCWAIGGPFFDTQGRALGWGEVSEGDALETLAAAHDGGVRLFDTAAVYGAGRSERLVGRFARSRSDVTIVTKVGLAFDEETKVVPGMAVSGAEIADEIERSRTRLERDVIDCVLLHANALPPEKAEPAFDAMEAARAKGHIRCFGWSTDFPDHARALAGRAGFEAVEHAQNVFEDVPTMRATLGEAGLTPLLRSPLAMGVLSGKFDAASRLGTDDVRSSSGQWKSYLDGDRIDTGYLERIAAIRELLETDGATAAQGALRWCLARSDRAIALPGARNARQAGENAAAISLGPLPHGVMEEIERLVEREPEGPPRER